MFAWFDAEVHNALNLLLESYAKQNEEVDIERSYTIEELSETLKTADVNLGIWDRFYIKIGDTFMALVAESLFNDPTQQHNDLYFHIQTVQVNYKAYKEMTERLDKKSMYSISHFFLCDVINHIRDMNQLRGKKIGCTVREDQKDYIRNYREKAKENILTK